MFDISTTAPLQHFWPNRLIILAQSIYTVESPTELLRLPPARAISTVNVYPHAQI